MDPLSHSWQLMMIWYSSNNIDHIFADIYCNFFDSFAAIKHDSAQQLFENERSMWCETLFSSRAFPTTFFILVLSLFETAWFLVMNARLKPGSQTTKNVPTTSLDSSWEDQVHFCSNYPIWMIHIWVPSFGRTIIHHSLLLMFTGIEILY